jgi:hypothetical protein
VNPNSGGRFWKGDVGDCECQGDEFGAVTGTMSVAVETSLLPLKFDGGKLEINASTAKDGEVIVEMLDLQGNQLAVSGPFSGDELRDQVTWNTEISKLRGSQWCCAFTLGIRTFSLSLCE